tara:strand:+ start:1012 stop:1329 length:318 start_codon:yes stop_codon:yes gene_type:complete
MSIDVPTRGHHLKHYLIGFSLAVILTIIPFTVVIEDLLPRQSTLILLAICATAQILVHLHFFLGVGFGAPRDNVIVLAFTCVLILIMLGGTMWIMLDLHARHGLP